jgi:hypothetical protein
LSPIKVRWREVFEGGCVISAHGNSSLILVDQSISTSYTTGLTAAMNYLTKIMLAISLLLTVIVIYNFDLIFLREGLMSAEVKVEKIKPKKRPVMIGRESSHVRLSARKAGLEISTPNAPQETDIA